MEKVREKKVCGLYTAVAHLLHYGRVNVEIEASFLSFSEESAFSKRANEKSTAYNGTARKRTGKLRLIRAATRTGISVGCGRRQNPVSSTSERSLSGGPGWLSIHLITGSGKYASRSFR